MYPGECYYCGACVMVCPKDAIELVHPLMNRAKFVPTRKPEEAIKKIPGKVTSQITFPVFFS